MFDANSFAKQVMMTNRYHLISVNSIMEGDGFYVSYNAHDFSVYGSDTTALVVGQMQKFYILNGDHRESYSIFVKQGFEACLSYFKAHISEINKFSDKLEA